MQSSLQEAREEGEIEKLVEVILLMIGDNQKMSKVCNYVKVTNRVAPTETIAKLYLEAVLSNVYPEHGRKFSWNRIGEMEAGHFDECDRVAPELKREYEKEKEKGAQERAKIIAQRMLEESESITKICEYTGLTEKQVKTPTLKKAQRRKNCSMGDDTMLTEETEW